MGLTQLAVANRLRRTVKTVSLFENGEIRLSDAHVSILASLYCTTERLIRKWADDARAEFMRKRAVDQATTGVGYEEVA